MRPSVAKPSDVSPAPSQCISQSVVVQEAWTCVYLGLLSFFNRLEGVLARLTHEKLVTSYNILHWSGTLHLSATVSESHFTKTDILQLVKLQHRSKRQDLAEALVVGFALCPTTQAAQKNETNCRKITIDSSTILTPGMAGQLNSIPVGQLNSIPVGIP